jgi:hypothetical protein
MFVFGCSRCGQRHSGEFLARRGAIIHHHLLLIPERRRAGSAGPGSELPTIERGWRTDKGPGGSLCLSGLGCSSGSLGCAGRNANRHCRRTCFGAANTVTAVLFGLGHLPATAALAPLSGALVVRAVVLNGTAGLVFGSLYRRYGLEWAMTSHRGVDIVARVAVGV